LPDGAGDRVLRADGQVDARLERNFEEHGRRRSTFNPTLKQGCQMVYFFKSKIPIWANSNFGGP
jgi:hypothetical protein